MTKYGWLATYRDPAMEEYFSTEQVVRILRENKTMLESKKIPKIVHVQDHIKIPYDSGFIRLYRSQSGTTIATVETEEPRDIVLILEGRELEEAKPFVKQP